MSSKQCFSKQCLYSALSSLTSNSQRSKAPGQSWAARMHLRQWNGSLPNFQRAFNDGTRTSTHLVQVEIDLGVTESETSQTPAAFCTVGMPPSKRKRVLDYHDVLLYDTDVDLLEGPNWLNDQVKLRAVACSHSCKCTMHRRYSRT